MNRKSHRSRTLLTLAGTWICAFGGSGRLHADFPLPPAATGNLYVSSFGTDEIFCYSPLGTVLYQFSHEDLDGPRGLGFSPGGELYVASQNSDRILVFLRDGAFQRQLAAPGLDGPTGLAFGPAGKLYVSSFQTNDILVFTGDVHETSFSADGLIGPNCPAFGPDGSVYVTSQLTNELYRFNPDGSWEPSMRYTAPGMSSPMGVAIYGGRIYVTGGASHSVTVFDLATVNFIENISTSPLVASPQGIAFDATGRFVISSFSSAKVARLDTEGNVLLEFEEAGMRTARSVAYEPLSDVELRFVRGDFNGDDFFDISDAVATLGHLFLGVTRTRCLDAGDTNDDGKLDISDGVFSLNHLFLGGPPPPPPHPEPGEDPTADDLDCR